MAVHGRRARLGVPLVVCLAALAFAAPAVAHPEACLGSGAAWASVSPWAAFTSEDGTCTPASVAARYDTSAAPLGPGETDGRNLALVANLPKQGGFANAAAVNSDLAFWGNLAFEGNFNGFRITDISDPAAPRIISQVHCPGSQNDISVWNNLLFLSTDSSRSDDSCQSVTKPVTDPTAWEGIKVFDISDPANPRYIKSVETDCGSHTHTLVPDGNRVLLYVSSYLLGPTSVGPDCQLPHDKISIVEVPLATPTSAAVIAEPVLFPDGGNPGNGYTAQTTGCHDITVYRAKNLAAGACMGDGIIMDISDPANPRVIARMQDPNFAFWHSATISHDAKKVLFTDERGGGVGAECNPTVGPQRGADAVYSLRRRDRPAFLSYFKIPRTQADTENCVAHNGNLMPIRGRDILVQAWYQGGISVIDWTNGRRIRELAWWDRGPFEDPNTLAGEWSSYWYNGRIFSTEIQRGLDVHRLTGQPGVLALASQRLPYLNAQTQEPLTSGNDDGDSDSDSDSD